MSRSRLIFDAVLIASIVALSFLPAVGAAEGHFAVAAQSLRIIAGIYTLFVVLANTILGRHSRLALDLAFALFLASMAWFETFPANNHAREAAIYAAIAGIVAVLGVMGSRQAERVTA
ncbi:MAG TPA: hypothetical protein VEK79_06840 [Thermoanaerobaculia bacterium]|nr:hypothetical protein [Thermoanaerobaculia bacterium]